MPPNNKIKVLKTRRIYIFIIASIAILVLDYFGLLNFLKNPLDQVIIPFKKEIFTPFQNFKNLSSMISSYSQIYQFYQRKDELSRKNEELQFKVNKLTEENAKLRNQLEAVFPSSVKFVPGQVISISRYMEIDVGEKQGVAKGQIVVIGETLIGRVVEVTSSRSKIMLLTDPDFKISAQTQRGAKGEAAGQSHDTVLLTKILQKDPLFLDDQVVTTGEEFTPPNLLIGKISFISQEETAPYKQAKITPVINFAKEKIVFVITSL